MKNTKEFAMLVAGLLIGFVACFLLLNLIQITPSGKPSSQDFSKNLTKAVEEINRQVKMSYPNISVRVKNYTYAGEFYLVNLEFYDNSGTLTTAKYYLSADGKKIALEDYFMSLEREMINVSEDDDPWVGAEKPKVTIVEFSDYACPYCARFALEVEKKLMENYSNVVKLVFRDMPVHGNISYKAAMAANCAKEQGKFWEYHYLLFERQNEWYENDTLLYKYAEDLGLNAVQFKDCLDSEKYRSEVEKDVMDAQSYGVTGTPTFFISGEMVTGYRSYESFAKLIEEKLK
ncbi:MAG: DsbA family protein [Archaeoglobaceae archaeon]|nr:DsbA family protein [Archaeoglobaceae archaeon]MDW8118374.1 DsbA family protein [Archaeoglobaceae archaeon]